jgi:hypothetical protein
VVGLELRNVVVKYPIESSHRFPRIQPKSDLPLICRWAEITVMAEQAAGELAAQGMVTADGKVSPWFAIPLKVAGRVGAAVAPLAAGAGRQGTEDAAVL